MWQGFYIEFIYENHKLKLFITISVFVNKMSDIYPFKTIHRRLQFDVYDHEIPKLQQSIDAIDDPEQQILLQQIRDRKVNQETLAAKGYDTRFAVNECQRCIRVLNTLKFHTNNEPRATDVLYKDDICAITTTFLEVTKDANGNTVWREV